MLIKELFGTTDDGIKLYRYYSNEGFEIREVETGTVYGEIIVTENSTNTYEETETLIVYVEGHGN